MMNPDWDDDYQPQQTIINSKGETVMPLGKRDRDPRKLTPSDAPPTKRSRSTVESSHKVRRAGVLERAHPKTPSFSWDTHPPVSGTADLISPTRARTPVVPGLERGHPNNSSFSWNSTANAAVPGTVGPPLDPPAPLHVPARGQSFSWDLVSSPPTNPMAQSDVPPTPRFQIAPAPPSVDLKQSSFSWDSLSPTRNAGGAEAEESPSTSQPPQEGALTHTHSSSFRDASPRTDVMGKESVLLHSQSPTDLASDFSYIPFPRDHTLLTGQPLALEYLSPTLNAGSVRSNETPTSSHTQITEVDVDMSTDVVLGPGVVAMDTDMTSPFARARSSFGPVCFPWRSPPSNSTPSSVQMDEDPLLPETKVSTYPLPPTLFSGASGTPGTSTDVIGRAEDSRTPAVLGLEYRRSSNSSFSWDSAMNTTASGVIGALPPSDPPRPLHAPPRPLHASVSASSFSLGPTPPPLATNTTPWTNVTQTPRTRIAPLPPPVDLGQSSFSWGSLSPTQNAGGAEVEESPPTARPPQGETWTSTHTRLSFSWDASPRVDAMEMEPGSPYIQPPGLAPMHTDPSHTSFPHGNSLPGPGVTRINGSPRPSQTQPRFSYSLNATPPAHGSDAMESDPPLPPTRPTMNRDTMNDARRRIAQLLNTRVCFHRDTFADDALNTGETLLDTAIGHVAEAASKFPEPITDMDLILKLVRQILSETSNETSTPRKSARKGQPSGKRDAAVLLMQFDVRAHARKLMSRDKYTSTIYAAEHYDVENFTDGRHPGPSLNNFLPDISSPKSKWNQALAFVFAKDFVNSGKFSPQHVGVVERAFSVHLNQIIRMYKAQKRSDPAEVQAAKDHGRAAAREGRRRKLHERRWGACLKHPDLAKYYQLLHRINFKLASEDESCKDTSECVITNMPWRNPQIIEFLRALDVVHVSTRFRDRKPTRGNWPRHRRCSARRDLKTDPVPGLPSNFYDPTWLASRTEFELARLDIQPAMELDLSDRVKQIVEQYKHVKGRAPLPHL